MTVPSMPIMSAVTRSVPSAATAMPRKMLPAPITMAICTPVLAASTIWLGHGIEEFRLDAERLVAGQHFAGDFQQDALVARFGHWAPFGDEEPPAIPGGGEGLEHNAFRSQNALCSKCLFQRAVIAQPETKRPGTWPGRNA